jgi:hypothetical protein
LLIVCIAMFDPLTLTSSKPSFLKAKQHKKLVRVGRKNVLLGNEDEVKKRPAELAFSREDLPDFNLP